MRLFALTVFIRLQKKKTKQVKIAPNRGKPEIQLLGFKSGIQYQTFQIALGPPGQPRTPNLFRLLSFHNFENWCYY